MAEVSGGHGLREIVGVGQWAGDAGGDRRTRPGRGQVALGKQQPVGHCHLAHGLVVSAELIERMGDIDRRHHAVEPVALGQEGLGHQGVDHRRRVGQAGGLDQHPAQALELAPQRAHEEPLERSHEVSLHAAADAAGIEHDQTLVDLFHQMVVDADRAELVDQHRAAVHLRLAQQVVEQGGLAGTEEAGEQGHRDATVGIGGGRGGGAHGCAV